MSDRNLHIDETWDLEPIDGIHELRQRRKTRLWYRALPSWPLLLRRPARLSHADAAVEPVPDPAPDQLAEIARIAIAAGRRAEPQSASAAPGADDIEPSLWQFFPPGCPSLMLSASPTLGGKLSDAQLAPGAQFRVRSISNGVAQIDVVSPHGQVVQGFCNTVDLACAGSAAPASRLGAAMSLLPRTGKPKFPNLAQGFGAAR